MDAKLVIFMSFFLSIALTSSCSRVDKMEEGDSASSKVEDVAEGTEDAVPETPPVEEELPTPVVEEVPVEQAELVPAPEASPFLKAEDLVNPHEKTLEVYSEELRIFLNSDRGFQNPLLPRLEGQDIVADEFCPELMWGQLTASVYQKHTLVIDQGFGYECQRVPETSTINFKSFALVGGKFYLHLYCPNTDLTEYQGEAVRGAFPWLTGANPKLCANDPESKVLMQYKFEVKNDISFVLLTSTPVRTQEHSIFRFSFSDPELGPCVISKEGEQFKLSTCLQTRWQETLSFKRWRDNLLNFEQEGVETTDFSRYRYENALFMGTEKGFQGGGISFEKNSWLGEIQYTPSAAPSVQAKFGENELNESLAW